MYLCFDDNIEASEVLVRVILGREDFAELPEVYVIFITEHDVLGGGLPIYTIDWKINETGGVFGCSSDSSSINFTAEIVSNFLHLGLCVFSGIHPLKQCIIILIQWGKIYNQIETRE